MAKKAPAIPLKDIMAALDKRDKGYYNRLTPEQKSFKEGELENHSIPGRVFDSPISHRTN